jgi:hypothetical protein
MKRSAVGLVVLALCGAFLTGTVLGLADVSRSFLTDASDIVPGTLVSVQPNGTVALTNLRNEQRLVGVVLAADTASLLTLNRGEGRPAVQVSESGIVNMYASTLNGDVHAGNMITVSPLSGIGMAATTGLRTVGIAQADLTSTTVGVKPFVIHDHAGQSKRVFVGTLPVLISSGGSESASASPGFIGNLQALAATAVGHPVSTSQAVISLVVTVVSMAALIALVYGTIRASVVAVGRNPLARASIYKILAQVFGMVVVIAVVAMAILYLMLR